MTRREFGKQKIYRHSEAQFGSGENGGEQVTKDSVASTQGCGDKEHPGNIALYNE